MVTDGDVDGGGYLDDGGEAGGVAAWVIYHQRQDQQKHHHGDQHQPPFLQLAPETIGVWPWRRPDDSLLPSRHQERRGDGHGGGQIRAGTGPARASEDSAAMELLVKAGRQVHARVGHPSPTARPPPPPSLLASTSSAMEEFGLVGQSKKDCIRWQMDNSNHSKPVQGTMETKENQEPEQQGQSGRHLWSTTQSTRINLASMLLTA